MITLQEIQTLKTKLSGIRDRTVQAKTLYDSTMARLVESLNKMMELLQQADPENQPEQFVDKFSHRVFSTVLNDAGAICLYKITSIEDVGALEEITDYVNSILAGMEEDIQKKYTEISQQVEEWQNIIRGEQNATM